MTVLHVGAGTTVGALTVFPIWTDAPTVEEDYNLFSQVEADGMGHVEELPSPTVPLVQAVNAAMLPGLLIEGEAVRGGLQDRVVIASTMVPAQATAEVPVACVEAQRWHGEDRQHTAGRMPPSLRREVSARLAADGRSTDQGAVWAEVARHRTSDDLAPGGSMVEAMAVRPEAVDIPVLEGQRGVAIGIGGTIRSVEVFDRHETLVGAWPNLLRAAAVDARTAPTVPTSASAARRAVRRVGRAANDRPPGAAGHSTPLCADGLNGTTLWWNGRRVHLAMHAEATTA